MKFAHSIFLFFLLFNSVLWGIRTHRITHFGYEHFITGELENIRIDSNGTLSNASSIETIGSVQEPIVWKGVCTPDGLLYLGTGNRGQILKIQPDGKNEVIFRPDEILARSIAVDRQGYVYAGTSPNGKVYRIPPDGGIAEIYFNPKETYIWDLLFDPAGNLFVAVGNGGKIYKLSPDYKKDDDAEVWFDSGNTHLYKMTLDKDGHLITGSGPKGYLYRVTDKNKAEILYSTNDKEISQIVTMEDGSILFATFSKPKKPENNNGTPKAKTQSSSNQVFSRIYRMNPDGHVNNLWSPTNTSIFSLYPNGDSEWLVGSGNEGRLYTIDKEGDWSLLQTMPNGGQITDIHPIQGSLDQYLVITSNPSWLYQLSLNPKKESKYLSDIVDARNNAFWGRIVPMTMNPENQNLVHLETRTGNSPKPDITWSNWEKTDELFRSKSPSGRFLQYKLQFDNEGTQIRKIDLYYHHENQRPEISHVHVLPVGFALLKNDLAKINLGYDKITGKENPARYLKPKKSPPKLILESPKDAITVGWRASDANQDELEFKVKLRKMGEPHWVTLQDKLTEPFYSTGTNGLEDGYYEIQVTADDRLSNPRNLAMQTSKTSLPFPIDTQAPKIEILKQNNSGNSANVTLKIIDQMSNIYDVDYKVSGNQTFQAFPQDNLFDSKIETIEIEIDFGNASNEKTLLIEARDETGNRSVEKIIFP